MSEKKVGAEHVSHSWIERVFHGFLLTERKATHLPHRMTEIEHGNKFKAKVRI